MPGEGRQDAIVINTGQQRDAGVTLPPRQPNDGRMPGYGPGDAAVMLPGGWRGEAGLEEVAGEFGEVTALAFLEVDVGEHVLAVHAVEEMGEAVGLAVEVR